MLPRVLYRIGQVVATPKMAIPVLELLANIVGLRSLYNGFVEQQYLGVFGIALPYMDQSKYTCTSVYCIYCVSFEGTSLM